MFKTINEGIEWIESVKKFGDKLDLSRMVLACKLLGNPEQKLPVIHIAGTNGKGSTVSYLKYMLLEQGYNVGTYTSPYIVRFNERINYNNTDISNDDLLFYINKIKETHDIVWKEHNEIITFFELVTLISFMYFSDQDIDFAIYEVGLGGLLDATNVVNPLITAITTISYDHMGVLGDSLEEIALNKLGIVKDMTPLVTTVSDPELLDIFKNYTKKKQSKMTVINGKDITNTTYGSHTNFEYKNDHYSLSLLGTHQVRNASLAIEILYTLENMDLLTLDKDQMNQGLIKTTWPGRMERFGNVILDGAHNIGSVNVLKDSITTLFPDKKIKVLYTSMADKEYFDIIQVLESFCDEITFTQFDYPRCETAKNLYTVSSHTNKHMNVHSYEALKELKPLPNEILLVTGSLYFISHIRKALV